MERTYKPADIAERYGVSERTAKTYMRKMIHMEKPWLVTESALMAYEMQRTIDPNKKPPATHKPARIIPSTPDNPYHIPRRKEMRQGCCSASKTPPRLSRSGS